MRATAACSSPAYHEVVSGIPEELARGVPLSRALAGFPEVFDPGFQAMVRAGEESGALAPAEGEHSGLVTGFNPQ